MIPLSHSVTLSLSLSLYLSLSLSLSLSACYVRCVDRRAGYGRMGAYAHTYEYAVCTCQDEQPDVQRSCTSKGIGRQGVGSSCNAVRMRQRHALSSCALPRAPPS